MAIRLVSLTLGFRCQWRNTIEADVRLLSFFSFARWLTIIPRMVLRKIFPGEPFRERNLKRPFGHFFDTYLTIGTEKV
jgi:hypothetical protein